MLTQLLHSRNREAEEFATDFGAHKPAKGYEMLVETESTMKTHLSEAVESF